MELYWIYAFNIVINSVLSFCTTMFLVRLLIHFLRIKHPRIQMVCNFLPFFKICLDPFLYHFSSWALLHEINPILEAAGTRQFSFMVNPFIGIQFSMQDGKTFSLADIAALSLDPLWVQLIGLIAVIGAIILCTLKIIRLWEEKTHTQLMVRAAILFTRLHLKPSLFLWMKKRKVVCALTSGVTSPCIVGKTILFPEHLLENLSQEEFEAIIAHEMAHLQWKDCLLRITYSFIAAMFWWIPTRREQKRIEELQEQASDAMIYRFSISRFALAEAILKTANASRSRSSQFAVSFVGRPLSLKKRMQLILQEPERQTMPGKLIQSGLLGLCLASILFGKLWIF